MHKNKKSGMANATPAIPLLLSLYMYTILSLFTSLSLSLSLPFLSLSHTQTHYYFNTSDGTSRNFVQVMSTIENTTTLIVTCQFTNQLDSSNKSCDVLYGLCERQSVSGTAQGVSSPDQPTIARVVLDFDDSADMYCFNVMASNGTFTAFIENRTSSSMTDSEVTMTTGITGE